MIDARQKQNIKDVDVKGLRVLVRCDLNVPLEEGKILDDTRVNASLKTINYLIENKAKVIILSHLGRPKGEVNKKYSLMPVRDMLSQKLSKEVLFCEDIISDKAKEMSKNLNEGDVMLMENVRFYKQEEENDENFAKSLSELGDIYVNDAFGVCHRSHASNAAITKYLKSYIGILIEEEFNFLNDFLFNKKENEKSLALLGGSKVSDKILVIKKLIEKTDSIAIGGAMANTFLKALGYNTGDSKVEEDRLDIAKEILDYAKEKNCEFILPCDFLAAKTFDKDSEFYETEGIDIKDGYISLDVGKKSCEVYEKLIEKSDIIFFNGPVGVYEWDNFENGTKCIINALAKSKAKVLVGGGDSAASVKKFKLEDKMTFISTGGGASLKYIEKEDMKTIHLILNK